MTALSNTTLYFSLDVPVFRTLHPFFHPNRSKFFNMATVYLLVIEALYEHFEGKAMTKAYSMPEEADLAYISYKRWNENGGKELQLSGFKLTNLQMFWLCYAHFAAIKFHHNYPENLNKELKLLAKYMHVYFKNSQYFREAYKCEAMTESEAMQFEEFNRLYEMISKQS